MTQTRPSPTPTPAPNLAHAVFERVEASRRPGSIPLPRARTGGPRSTWKQAAERVEAVAAGLWRWASRRKTGSVSHRPRGSSGSWPTWRSCAPARRRPPSTRAPTARTPPTSSPTPTHGSSSPKTTRSWKRSTEHRERLARPCQGRGVRRTSDGDSVITLDELAELGAKRLADTPRACAPRQRKSPRPAGDPDLHLRDDGQAQRMYGLS